MKQWEYKVHMVTVSLDSPQSESLKAVEQTLNDYGKDGWELIQGISGELIFKRHLQ